MNYGERLKKFRLSVQVKNKHGKMRTLSQGGLARAAGVAMQTVHRIEKGETEDPDIPTLRALALALIDLGCNGIDSADPTAAFTRGSGGAEQSPAEALSRRLLATALAAQQGDASAVTDVARFARQIVAAEELLRRAAKKRGARRKH